MRLTKVHGQNERKRMDVTILIFLLVYAAMGLGKLPGFKVDRTGAAVVGALAMMIAGSIARQAAWNAIDYKTVGMLFGLMVVSAAFVVSGFYGWVAQRVTALKVAASLACHPDRGRWIFVGDARAESHQHAS
jgi:Na+/H+ antiporter NhaD/arsenite permease-like protein